MRSQLLVSGLLVALLGAAFYTTQIPLAYSWSIVFIGGGASMSALSFLAKESTGPVTPPEGYRFCRFCSSAVPLQASRCSHCNGIQQIGGS
ncbi:MAG TPA: hypothetical protein VKF15_07625 [Nitrososphaerales archaeon]|nr:hypothetical protein [Nitrososphaerales archaeon]